MPDLQALRDAALMGDAVLLNDTPPGTDSPRRRHRKTEGVMRQVEALVKRWVTDWMGLFRTIGFSYEVFLLAFGLFLGMSIAGWLDRVTIAKNEQAINRVAQDSAAFQTQAQQTLSQMKAVLQEVQTQGTKVVQVGQAVVDTRSLVESIRQTTLDALTPEEQERLDLRQRVRALEQTR